MQEYDKEFKTTNSLAETKEQIAVVKNTNMLLPKVGKETVWWQSVSLVQFFGVFKSFVHNSDALQKFHFLRNSLEEAATVIISLNASEENYLVTQDLLKIQYNQLIQLLLEFPEISYESPSLLGQFEENGLKALNQRVKNKDTF